MVGLYAHTPTGKWLEEHVTCLKVPAPKSKKKLTFGGANDDGADEETSFDQDTSLAEVLQYTRLQVNFREKTSAGVRGVFIPGKANSLGTGTVSLGQKLKSVLSSPSWALVKSGCNSQVKKPTLHLSGHHIALAARLLNDPAPIPLDCGKGGSVSHICDVAGCIKPSHVLKALKHKANMARINCPGSQLITYGLVILEFRPCAHAERDPFGLIDNSTCCARLNHTDLADLRVGLSFPVREVQERFDKLNSELNTHLPYDR